MEENNKYRTQAAMAKFSTIANTHEIKEVVNMDIIEITEFAKNYGFDGVKDRKLKYKGYDVYSFTLNLNTNIKPRIGPPRFILVKKDVIKISSETESKEIYLQIVSMSK